MIRCWGIITLTVVGALSGTLNAHARDAQLCYYDGEYSLGAYVCGYDDMELRCSLVEGATDGRVDWTADRKTPCRKK